MKNSKMLVASAVLAVGGGLIIGTSAVSAQTNGETLVDRIASQFSLNQEEVQSVFDDFKEDKRADRQAAMEEKLNDAVTDGTITQDQKSEIIAQLEEHKTLRLEMHDSDLSREEMREQMQQLRDEFKQWAEESGIDLSALELREGRGHGRGHGPGIQ